MKITKHYYFFLIFLIIPIPSFAEDILLINPSFQCKKYLSESFSNILKIDDGIYKVQIVDDELTKNNKVLIIDCHSFPTYALPYELYQEIDRPDICIGTDNFHTSEKIKNSLGEMFKDLNFTVKYNEPFKGSIVPLKFYNNDKRVQSVMIEVKRDLYMNQDTGKKMSIFLMCKIN